MSYFPYVFSCDLVAKKFSIWGLAEIVRKLPKNIIIKNRQIADKSLLHYLKSKKVVKSCKKLANFGKKLRGKLSESML